MEKPRNPNAGKWKSPNGYKELGWQRHAENCEEVKQCYEKGHFDLRTEPHVKEFDNSLFKNRCTDVVKFCDECKIVWHIDMSD